MTDTCLLQAWCGASSNVTRRTALGFVMAAGCDTAWPSANQDSEGGASDPAVRLLCSSGQTRGWGAAPGRAGAAGNTGPTRAEALAALPMAGTAGTVGKARALAACAGRPHPPSLSGAGSWAASLCALHSRPGLALHPCPLGFPGNAHVGEEPDSTGCQTATGKSLQREDGLGAG